jgi:hypothetical protein
MDAAVQEPAHGAKSAQPPVGTMAVSRLPTNSAVPSPWMARVGCSESHWPVTGTGEALPSLHRLFTRTSPVRLVSFTLP